MLEQTHLQFVLWAYKNSLNPNENEREKQNMDYCSHYYSCIIVGLLGFIISQSGERCKPTVKRGYWRSYYWLILCMTKNRKERPSHNESRSFLFILISYLENTFHCFQHTFFLDRIKVGFYCFGQSWDIIQIFTPLVQWKQLVCRPVIR